MNEVILCETIGDTNAVYPRHESYVMGKFFFWKANVGSTQILESSHWKNKLLAFYCSMGYFLTPTI